MPRRLTLNDHLQFYGIGVLAAGVAVLARALLGETIGLVYITFYPAIVASGWWAGFGPALLTTAICAVAANLLWLSPEGSLLIHAPRPLVGWTFFLAIGSLLAALSAGFRRAQGRIQAMLDAMGDGFAAVDRKWRYTYLNPRYAALMKRSASALIGQRLWEVFPDLGRTTFSDAARRAMDEGASGQITAFFQALDRWLEIEVYPSADGIVIFARDVSAAREMEERRAAVLAQEQAAREQLEAANRMKDEFLATLSHELRTPLNAVMGWAQLLGSGASSASADRAIPAIQRNALLLKQLVDDLLDVSRIASGKLQLERQPVDFARVARDAVDVIRPGAESRRCDLEIVTPADPLWVMGDASRLRQALWNLLSNAVKFTPEGGRIEVRVARAGSSAEVRVRDTGIGIAPDLLPHVFDRFVQADTSPARRAGGLGLGLAIVRHIVEASGGTVSASSPGLDGGSTFTIALPAAAGRIQEETEAGEPRRLAGRTVLVLENDEDARRLAASVLEDYGAVVVEARTVGEAIEALAVRTPDVVIADLALGGETGFDLAERVRMRREVDGRSIRLLALTAYTDEHMRARAREAGFEAYVTKPWRVEDLMEAIGGLLVGESEL